MVSLLFNWILSPKSIKLGKEMSNSMLCIVDLKSLSSSQII